ncbi:MAG TPA: hypothetical protein VFM37_16520 [Pseudonocardiaceae bacterium]|nr:hypothetical protein [Pseudonocardiaceae bacterium]
MHVLVTEAQFGNAERIVRRLREQGVRVSTCHDRVGYCRVLAPGGRCPLDDFTDPVDLVVDVRGVGDELTAREYGVACAVRAMRDVVVVPVEPGLPATVPAGLAGVAGGLTEEQLIEWCRRGPRVQAAAADGWAGRPEPPA